MFLDYIYMIIFQDKENNLSVYSSKIFDFYVAKIHQY